VFLFLTRRSAVPVPHAAPAIVLQARLTAADTHYYGNPNARLTVVEFGDFECPFCRRAEAAAAEVRQKLGNRVRFAFRQFPLTTIHPYAEKAAEASECAAQQGKFWQAVDYFYAHQSNLTVPALEKYAGDLGLNQAQFDQCLSSGEMAARVQQDIRDGQALGVSRVPTFFIGHEMVEGVLPYKRFRALIEQQLHAMTGTQTAASGERAPQEVQKTSASQQNLSRAVAPEPFGEAGSEPFGAGANAFSKIVASNGGCSADEAREKQPTMIGVAEARQLFEQGRATLFVDVRSPKKYAAGHIPGALDVPSGGFTPGAGSLPKNKTIVLYQGGLASGDICAASRAAGRALLSRGFPYQRVKVLKQGLAGWQKAGLPVQP
jgi:protein-disulfide isomerase/rhodanese-related sulfurtransferase